MKLTGRSIDLHSLIHAIRYDISTGLTSDPFYLLVPRLKHRVALRPCLKNALERLCRTLYSDLQEGGSSGFPIRVTGGRVRNRRHLARVVERL